MPNPCTAAQASKHSACSLDLWVVDLLKTENSSFNLQQHWIFADFFQVFRMLRETKKGQQIMGFGVVLYFFFFFSWCLASPARARRGRKLNEEKKWPLKKKLTFFSSKSHLEKYKRRYFLQTLPFEKEVNSIQLNSIAKIFFIIGWTLRPRSYERVFLVSKNLYISLLFFQITVGF